MKRAALLTELLHRVVPALAMGVLALIGAGGLLAVFVEGFKPLYFAFFVVVFVVCGWQAWLCLRDDVWPCLRDLWGKPTTVVGRVSSKIYEAPNHHYLVVEDQRFEVNAL